MFVVRRCLEGLARMCDRGMNSQTPMPLRLSPSPKRTAHTPRIRPKPTDTPTAAASSDSPSPNLCWISVSETVGLWVTQPRVADEM